MEYYTQNNIVYKVYHMICDISKNHMKALMCLCEIDVQPSRLGIANYKDQF